MWTSEMSPLKSKHFGPKQEKKQKENSLENSLIKGEEKLPGSTFPNFKNKQTKKLFIQKVQLGNASPLYSLYMKPTVVPSWYG